MSADIVYPTELADLEYEYEGPWQLVGAGRSLADAEAMCDVGAQTYAILPPRTLRGVKTWKVYANG